MQTYRPEIDGMRAIAVLSVILFHSGFKRFSGGYVGVDVFFVISGYLITSLILADMDQGKFSLMYFYERRARRILPALFLVLFCCLPFAYCWLLPSQLKEFGQALISVNLFASNIFYWMKSGYFAQAAELNPLVHTWSLAVEEQFYIVYPLLLIACSRGNRRLVVGLLIVLSLVSLIMAQWSGNFQLSPPFLKSSTHWFAQQEWSSFYLPIGRAWELLIGVISAFYLHGRQSLSCFYSGFISAIGLSLIFWSVLVYDSETPFPSFYTLVPTLGAMLIILFANHTTLVGKVLSQNCLIKLGLISYSAYLWHQPLLAFSKLRSEHLPNQWVNALLSALSLILAYLSWRFVETPFRNRRKFTRRQIFIGAMTIALVTICMGYWMIITDGARHRFNSSNTYILRLEATGNSGYTHGRCIYLMSHPSIPSREASYSRRMVIVGDSFGCDFVNMAMENDLLGIYETRFVYIHTHCQIYMGTENRDRFVKIQHKKLCATKNDIIYALPLIAKADVIILAASWQKWSADRLPGTIDALKLRQNQQLYVIGTKYFGRPSPVSYLNKPLSYRLQQRTRPHGYAIHGNLALRRHLNQSILVDIQQLLCGEDLNCPIFTPEGDFISYDGGHLTKEGASYIGRVILQHPPLNALLNYR